MTMKGFTLHSMYLDTAVIDQIRSRGINLGNEDRQADGSGSINPTLAIIDYSEPRVPFDTTAINKFLTISGLNGVAIPLASDPLDIYYKQLASGGSIMAGSKSVKATMNKGMLLPISLTASGTEPAVLSGEAVAEYDGTNLPLVIAKNQAQAAETTVSELYYCGPITINGTTYTGIQDITINFGIELKIDKDSGSPYVGLATAIRVVPTIEFTTKDMDMLADLGQTGAALASPAVIYFRKGLEGGARSVSADNLGFTITEGMAIPQTGDGSQGDTDTLSVKIAPTYNGSAAIMIYAADKALP